MTTQTRCLQKKNISYLPFLYSPAPTSLPQYKQCIILSLFFMATWKTILICVFEIMSSPNCRGSLFAIEKEKTITARAMIMSRSISTFTACATDETKLPSANKHLFLFWAHTCVPRFQYVP